MRTRAWVVYATLSGAAALAYFAFPGHHLEIWTPIGLSCVIATLIGIRVFRPQPVLAWYLLAAGELCFILGDTAYTVLTELMHQVNPFPSIADLAYLLTYPLWAAALWMLIRSRRTARDHASLLDALIITTGLGLLSWLYLVLPNFQADGLSPLQRVVSVAYPLGDVLVLALLARLVAAGGLRIPSVIFLAVGAIGLLAADVAYGLQQLGGSWTLGGPTDAGWALFYAAYGIAALHPSSTRVGEPVPHRGASVGMSRIVLLAAVSLVAPAVLLSEAAGGRVTHGVDIALFSAALYLLVIFRLAGIVGEHRRSLARERVLRSLGESLVAARDMSEVLAACVAGAAELVRDVPGVHAAVHLAAPDGMERVAGSPVSGVGGERGVSGVGDGLDARLWQQERPVGHLADRGTLSVNPLLDEDELLGMLVVRSPRALSAEEHGALSTLASQVALALRSATLEEGVRRQRSEDHFRALIQNASDVILVIDADGLVDYATPSFVRALGRTVAEVRGVELAGLLHPGDVSQLESTLAWARAGSADPRPMSVWRVRDSSATYLSFEVLFSNLLDDESVAGVVLTMRDVSERRVLEQQLKHQAFHDGLTGLPNRAFFRDQAAAALDQAEQHGTTLAMVMIDLDDFKVVNDTRGHGAGDELLREVAQRLRAALGVGDSIARFGGDEFALLVTGVGSVEEIEAHAERLVKSIARPFIVDGELLDVRASAGLVVTSGAAALTVSELLRCADLALLAAKDQGKGKVVLYHDDLHTRMLDRLARAADLQRAVRSGEFFMVYQPIVSLATGAITGAEALMRWQHPVHGLVSPLTFIELAEDTGLIVEMGRRALDSACAQARGWADQAHTSIRVTVNVSGRQLQEPTFVGDVRAILERHDLPPELLVLEITESMLVRDGSGIPERIQALRELGLQIAIDDFGTGYSSLGYLRHFPVDILKIDKSFVDGLGKSSDYDGAVARAVLALADALHIEVIAEGIEDLAQWQELLTLGCPKGQGFLFSRPLSPERLSLLLVDDLPLGGAPFVGVPTPRTRRTQVVGSSRSHVDGEI